MVRVRQLPAGARSRGVLRRMVLCTVPLVVVLAGCSASHKATGSAPAVGASSTAGSTTGSTGAGSTAASSSASNTPPAVITLASARTSADPSAPVHVAIAQGKLTNVVMTNAQRKQVAGSLAADGAGWQTTEDLGYGRSYSIVARGVDAAGRAVSKQFAVKTVAPNTQTAAYFQRIGGYGLTSGATYGVAIVPIVHFDEAITNKAAAQKALTVTTTPHVAGSWYWADAQNAHFRPQNYWPAGTKVTITSKIYGRDLGHGVYGQSDSSTSFTIGAKQIAIATDNAPKAVNKVRVYRNGVLVRTMNTSMGQHFGETVKGNYIDFHTMNGTYTVLEHDNPAIMSSASYGLPANAPGGYAPEPIFHATKISTDGIYLHYLTTFYAQDNGLDVSHGCLNLNLANSEWFFTHSTIGDPVQISGTGGPKIQIWQGGDWSVPWSTWSAGGVTN